jgi:hypothetical protein
MEDERDALEHLADELDRGIAELPVDSQWRP